MAEKKIFNMEVHRKWYRKTCTIGELWLPNNNGNQSFFCYTLEDVCRESKIWGKTAIPDGRYQLELTYSPKFTKRYGTKMPHLMNVPNYSRILIHRGNNHTHTHGCILIGMGIGKESISQSKVAFSKFMPILKKAFKTHDEVWIDVVDHMFDDMSE